MTKRPKKSPEQVGPEEALRRMKTFVAERKEKFVAAIKKSKDRDIYSGTRNE